MNILYFEGDFTVRIFDLDTSDSFLLPMSQVRKNSSDAEPIKTIEKKDSPMSTSKKRSILSHDYESDEEIAVTVEENELTTKITNAAPKPMEVFTSLAYCAENQTLCAATNQG